MIDELAGEILKTIGILMQMLPEPVKKVLENRAVQGVMKVTGGVSEIATGCGLCTTAVGCIQGIPLIIFGTNMAFEGIQDLWYTLRGELDKESKNLIKEATGHKVDNLVELSEIGMSIYAGKVASKKIAGKLGEESEKLSGLLKKTRKPASVVTRAKRLVKKFMPKKRYRKFKVVDIEELSKRQCLKPNIQLFAEGAEEVKIFQLGKKIFDKFNIENAYVKPKHLSTTSGNARKFLGATKKEAEIILKDAMKNGEIVSISRDGVSNLGNFKYSIILNAKKVIGTRGESFIKIVLSSDGGMLTAYPQNI